MYLITYLHIYQFIGVIIVCFLITVSTAFEYKLLEKVEYIDKSTGEHCQNISDIYGHLMMNQQPIAPPQNASEPHLTTPITITEPNIVEELAKEYDFIGDTLIRHFRRHIHEPDDFQVFSDVADDAIIAAANETIDLENKINDCQPVSMME